MTNKQHILRWERGRPPVEVADDLVDEDPLEIRVGNRAVSVTMRTPGHDEELAAGFLLSEGLIRSAADIVSIRPCAEAREGNVLNVMLAPETRVDLEKLTRHVFASSSCGVCGKATIESVRQQFDSIEPDDLRIDAEILQTLPDKLRAAQAAFDRTGGLHAAGLFDPDGTLLVAREDVGRHNAVDKVLGWAMQAGRLPLRRQILLVSGRASFEIMQKALAGRAPVVAAVSAPSRLAVDFARESGQTLVGFLRRGRMNVYAHPGRLNFS
jgi:FdhD protein